jgi:hypothetical protein
MNRLIVGIGKRRGGYCASMNGVHCLGSIYLYWSKSLNLDHYLVKIVLVDDNGDQYSDFQH